MKMIVGLGNPGQRYEVTRHNIGFLIIDRIAAQLGVALDKRHRVAQVGLGSIEGKPVVLAKPLTYMNRSGEAVAALLQELGIATDDLVVISDDLDLPLGRIRIRPSGSAGGHRGLASILESLAGLPFCRVRIGIGRPPEGIEAADYVLEPFTAGEREQLSEIVSRGADSLTCLVRDGLDRAMADYNRTN